MPLLLIFGPLISGDSPFFEVAAGFVLAAGIPFIKGLSVIARLCLVFAVIGTTLIYGDPHRWHAGLFITLGAPLLAFFILKGITHLLRGLTASLYRLRTVRDRT